MVQSGIVLLKVGGMSIGCLLSEVCGVDDKLLIALVGIVSPLVGALGALGGSWLQLRIAKDRNEYEMEAAFEARTWEVKSKALDEAIAACLRVSDWTLRDDADVDRVARLMSLAHSLAQTAETVSAPIETYASDATRVAFGHVRSMAHQMPDAPAMKQYFELGRAIEKAAATGNEYEADTLADRLEQWKDTWMSGEIHFNGLSALARAFVEEARKDLGHRNSRQPPPLKRWA